jgi:hypothetical protein
MPLRLVLNDMHAAIVMARTHILSAGDVVKRRQLPNCPMLMLNVFVIGMPLSNAH